jgi:hypothetical protein
VRVMSHDEVSCARLSKDKLNFHANLKFVGHDRDLLKEILANL